MNLFFSARSRSTQSAPRTLPLRVLLFGVLALLVVACTVVPVTEPATEPGKEPVTEQRSAQDKLSEIDQLFGWATQETPGCAVALSQNGEVMVNRAYGLANLESKAPITPETMFDIGSVQKQFVAAAILLLVEEGQLSLTDDIRTYFPELPAYSHTITVDHLLTHTSGMRDWTALLQLSGESEDALTLILRQRGLNFAPGEEWHYSNSGYVLLKELIARTTGMSFSEFAQERLFEPLGMATTVYASDVREVENRALAYEKEGDAWKLNILVGNERGDGGGLLTTAGNLLLWNDALTNERLGAFVSEKLEEPARLNNGRELSYARGLFLDEDPTSRIIWHSGSAAAYKSLLARFPAQGLSIAMLCNAGDSTEGERFANTIIDMFIPSTLDAENRDNEPEATTGTPAPDPSDKAGLFFNEGTGDPLRLVVQNGKLSVDGGPALVAVDADRYRNVQRDLSFMSEDEVEVHFPSADEMILTTSLGDTIRYHRAQPYTPTAADLEAFASRYESDELKAIMEIALAGGGLTVSLNGSQGFPLTPVDADTFQLSRMLFRFVRDEGGEVVGFDYSNPVLRHIHFTR